MKIRTGFVSNSSTSSFCVYGKRLSDEQYENILKKYDVDYLEDADTPLEFYPGYQGWAAGLPWECMGREQTLGDFQDQVVKILSEVMGCTIEAKDCCVIQDEMPG